MSKKNILISLAATAVLFTACGGGGDTTDPEESQDVVKPVFVTTADTRDVIGGMRNSINISLGKFLYDLDAGELYTFEATSDAVTGHNLSISGMGVLRFTSPASGDFTINVKATEKKGGGSESLVLSFGVVDADSVSVTRQVVKTGANDGGSGIDRSFTRTADDAQIVGVNGLTWSDLDGTMPDDGVAGLSYGAARDYCVGSGWRLPTIDELLDTVNYGKEIDLNDEPRRIYDNFDIDLLTSWANETANGDKFYLHNGGGAINPANGANFRTRCVQGDVQPSEHTVYTDINGNTHDLSTGLKWSKADVSDTKTVSEASGYCSSKGAGWRLPSINELRSVVQDGSISSRIADGQTMLVSATPYNDSDATTSLSWGIYLRADVTTLISAMQDDSQYAIVCVSPE